MKIKLLALSLIMMIVSACAGGSSNSSLPHTSTIPITQPTTAPIPKTQGGATFTITIPNTNANAATTSGIRKPKYVSTATQSIQIALTKVGGISYSGVTPVTANVTPTSGGCVAQSGTDSGTKCTLSMNHIPTGLDTFVVTTYSNTVAQGQTSATALSTNTTSATITTAAMTPVNFVLGGIIASLAVNVPVSVVPGTSSSGNFVTVTALDAANKTIIGAAPYSNGPIVITTDDSLSAISALTNITNAGGSSTFSYSGKAILTTEHIIATVGSITASGLIPVAANPSTLTMVSQTGITPTTLSGSGPYAITSNLSSVLQVQAVQAGWGSASGNPFTITNTCGSSVVVTTTGTDTFTMTSGGTAATCSITIAAGYGVTNVLNYTQSGTTGTGTIYVANNSNNTITTYNSSGVQQPLMVANLTNPRHMTTDSSGNVYVANTGGGNVYKYNASGGLMQIFSIGMSSPYGVAVNPAGTVLYVANYGNSTITSYNTTTGAQITGAGGTFSAGMSNPYGVAVH
jgi:hypothetical protein